MTLQAFEVGALGMLILGLAFFLVWVGNRFNLAAQHWGVAHIALAGASFLGHRFQLLPTPSLGAASVLLTGVFLTEMFAANRVLSGDTVSWGRRALGSMVLTALISVVGFGFDQLAAKVLVHLLMIVLFSWSAWLFYRKLSMPLVTSVFLLKVFSLAVSFLDGADLATVRQSQPIAILNWVASGAMALVLVYVAALGATFRLKQVLRHIPDAVLVRQLDGIVIFCNEAFAVMAGANSPQDLVGKPVPLLAADGEEVKKILRELNAVAGLGSMTTPMAIEREVRCERGKTFTAEIRYSNYLEFGHPVVVAQIRDITDRKQAEAERLRLVSEDSLTGLLNRQSLDLRLPHLLWEAQRAQMQCAMLLLDVHQFKRINDALGAKAGDDVLKAIAKILLSVRRERDFVFRLGGDEFVLIMTNVNVNGSVVEIESSAQDLLQRVKREIGAEDIRLTLRADIGIAFSSEQVSTADLLLQHAQLALDDAKQVGPGAVRFFEEAMDDRLVSGLRMESALRAAAAHSELELHYQPIVRAADGQLVKVEALLRWTNPTLGNVSPASFIPLAEQTDLIIDLGRWVLNEAVRQAAKWQRVMDNPPVVGINVSVKQFMHPDFEREIFTLLEQHQVCPEMVEFELTETLFAQQTGALESLIDRLRQSGFGLSLDDFGTGYSSLSYLARFRLTTVKVDRSFVQGMDEDEKKRSIINAIISMGHSLGLMVVAEGVETDGQRNCLISQGCDYLQGYLIGRPVPAELLTLTEF